MIRFLRWLRSLFAGVFTGIARFVAFLIVVAVVVLIVSLARGDGLPSNIVLTADLRSSLADSAARPPLPLATRPVTLMDLIFALDAASKDARIKGLVMKLGGGVSLSQAEELSTALTRFKAKGKFVIAQATAFNGPGMGDYLAATAADEIWVQPKSNFGVAGAGAGELFLKGLFDKIKAVPQMAKRSEYKSAADMFMEKEMTAPDREQLTRVVNSWYDTATAEAAKARKLTQAQVAAAFEASPQFAEEARDKGLIDRIGYDDDALASGTKRAGTGAKGVKISDYIKSRDNLPVLNANIAVIQASGEINDGTDQGNLFTGSSGIASDDLSAAIRQAAADKDIKAIVFRVDSSGGSVTASDQILDAIKKAQAKGRPVVVSMGSVAASGGYYVSASANRIVAEPATLTGSIGVLTGKVSFAGTQELIGVKLEEVAAGKNTLMDSVTRPFTDEQWANLNHQADVIYADFLAKVAAGRKLPLEQVADAARGRVWTGADLKDKGLVNDLGGFWTAAGLAAGLGKVEPGAISFRVYPKPKGFFDNMERVFGGTETSMHALSTLEALITLPEVENVVQAVHDAPRRGVELRAPGLLQLGGN